VCNCMHVGFVVCMYVCVCMMDLYGDICVC
jgi:hypothetical protein